MAEYYDEDHFDDPIEGYCVRCRESVEMEETQAVWTRRGMPATRGICPICGGTVFRMGRTDHHHEAQRPAAVDVAGTGGGRSPRLAKDTVYVSFAPEDEAIARQIADDLNKVGVAAWLHEADEDAINWAGGVHPALKDCKRMVLVLSPAALADGPTEATWRFFRDNRKPILIAQIAAAAPPDLIRRSPRFDFTANYKRAFREMMQALNA